MTAEPRLPLSARRRPRLTAAALGALMLAFAGGLGAQQWTRGEAVWNSTGCAGCHGGNLSLASMHSRLLTVADARAAADAASARNGSMAAVWNTLNDAQKNDASAYVAGYRAEGNVAADPGAALSVAAVDQSASTVVTLFNNGRAPMVVATNNGVRLSGAGAAHFSVAGVGSGCLAMTLQAGGSCRVTVTYRPAAAPNPSHVATLAFEHNGEPVATTSLSISGTLAAAPPPPSPAASGGGGALSALWLALLPVALRRRRRQA